MSRHSARRPIWPKLLALVVLCLILGAAIAWLGGLPPSSARERAAEPAATRAAEDRLGRMDRPQLVREVHRLEKELLAKDRKIAEMEIQLKLMSEGSRTKK